MRSKHIMKRLICFSVITLLIVANCINQESKVAQAAAPAQLVSALDLTRVELVTYAQKFVGNPYRYGRTSLTKGTDCSGFTMSIYAQFGFKIPRTSRAQATYGKKVSMSNLKPGDLLFYKNGSRVGHVAMYIGNNKVVHASNPSTGITISNKSYRRACGARRILA